MSILHMRHIRSTHHIANAGTWRRLFGVWTTSNTASCAMLCENEVSLLASSMCRDAPFSLTALGRSVLLQGGASFEQLAAHHGPVVQVVADPVHVRRYASDARSITPQLRRTCLTAPGLTGILAYDLVAGWPEKRGFLLTRRQALERFPMLEGKGLKGCAGHLLLIGCLTLLAVAAPLCTLMASRTILA